MTVPGSHPVGTSRPQPPWSIRPAQNEDIPAAVSVLNQVFGHWGNEEDYAWKYLQSPSGFRLPAWIAESDGKVVAHYGMVALEAVLGGAPARAGQSVDAGVLPDFRRLGIISAIEQEIMNQAERAGVSLIYAFPGLRSLKMHDRIGYSPFAFVPEMTCLVNPGQALVHALRLLPGDARAAFKLLTGGARKMPAEAVARLARVRMEVLFILALATARRRPRAQSTACQVEALPQPVFGPEFDRFWQTAPAPVVSLRKDSAYLNWRYTPRLTRQYTTLVARGRGGLLGYLVMTQRSAWRWEITELHALADEEQAFHALLSEARARVARANGLALTVWSNEHTPADAALQQQGYVSQRVMQRWKTFHPWLYQIILYTRHLPDARQQDVLRLARRWPISMGDSDLA